MHLEMVTSPADEQNLRTSTEKQNEVSPPIIHSLLLPGASPGRRSHLKAEGLAPEECVHVEPEGVAELLSLWMLMLGLVPGVIVGVLGALEEGV